MRTLMPKGYGNECLESTSNAEDPIQLPQSLLIYRVALRHAAYALATHRDHICSSAFQTSKGQPPPQTRVIWSFIFPHYSMLTISQSPTHQLPCLLTPTPHTIPCYQAPYILRCFGVLNYDLPTLKIVLDPLMYNHAISIASRNMYMMKTSLTIAQAIVGDVSSWRKRYLVALLCRLNTNISYLNRSLTHYYGSNKKLYNFVCASPIAD